MSQINVNTIGARTGTTVSTASGNTINNASGNALSAGLELLSGNTISGSSGVTVDNVFTSTYTNYKVIISWNASHSGTSSCKIILRAGGNNDTNSKYTSGVRTFRINSDNEFETRNDVQSSGWDLAGIDATQTGNQLSRELTIYSPQVSKRTGFSGTGLTDEVTNQQMMYLGGAFEDTTSFDGITIKPAAGTVSGQVNIYGIVE
jgi:hypothetical protein